ncbi:MAG: IS200/IS605 family transposase [Planctomycetota bacterium]
MDRDASHFCRRPEGAKDLQMPGTYSQILIHMVFSTKERRASITPEIQPRLYDYIGGIVRAEKGALYAIGSMPDHVHILLRRRTNGAIADLMRTIKARSSLWVHQTFANVAAFAWQEGYSVFSVSKSAESDVKSYIENQLEHHKKRDFEEELLTMLRAHAIQFEERYVFD